MPLSRIVMRLARNPGTEFADGDDHRGYTLIAPLTPDNRFDEAAFRADADAATVRRFTPEDDAEEGRLARRGDGWAFDYGEVGDEAEPLYRLGSTVSASATTSASPTRTAAC